MKPVYTWTLGQEPMLIVDKAPGHLGFIRGTKTENTERETVAQNISKACKASYSLMSAGFHGENGLDPITCVHLYRTFILPILTYGLEVLQWMAHSYNANNVGNMVTFKKVQSSKMQVILFIHAAYWRINTLNFAFLPCQISDLWYHYQLHELILSRPPTPKISVLLLSEH